MLRRRSTTIAPMGPIRKRIYWWRYEHLCKQRGWHWPVKWDEDAYPASYDPPHPSEPGFCCQTCGKVREPYRAWWWDVKRRWYEARGIL